MPVRYIDIIEDVAYWSVRLLYLPKVPGGLFENYAGLLGLLLCGSANATCQKKYGK